MHAVKSIFLSVVILSLSGLSQAHASTIDYLFTGTFDGSLGSTSYLNQSFSIDLTSNSSTVMSGGGELSNQATAAIFSVGSLSGNLTGSYNDVVLNPGFASGTVIFGQGQSSDPFFVGEGLSAPSLSTYDLTKALPATQGTISQTAGSVFFTSLGNLQFNDITSLSFQARGGDGALATPLSSSALFFSTGFLLLAFAACKKHIGKVQI